ncbi:transposase [Stenotrophomonas pavanii]|uniref:transposase n=1 Tax=Stenotrophomonas pavanii TaxID=487698 RepID=UPI0040415590
MSRITRRSYTDEFKHQAVELAESLGPAAAARQLEMSVKTLANWLDAVRAGRSLTSEARRPATDLESEISRLRAENANLKMEREILKKAAVSSTRQCNMINSCTDRSERYGKDGAARHVSSPEARSMATMEGRPVAQRHCPLL